MRKLMLAAAVGLAAPTAFAVTAEPAEAQRRYYDRGGAYSGPVWRGDDGRTYCRRRNGTTGLIVGGAAGALAGRAIDTRGERATGTILGAAAGALVGREVDRRVGRRCR